MSYLTHEVTTYKGWFKDELDEEVKIYVTPDQVESMPTMIADIFHEKLLEGVMPVSFTVQVMGGGVVKIYTYHLSVSVQT